MPNAPDSISLSGYGRLMQIAGEIVRFDPEDETTYPSVCQTPEEVASRFGFTGGERLLFDRHGAYVGEVVKTLPGGPASD